MIGYLVSCIVRGDGTAAEFSVLPAEVMMPFMSPLRELSSGAEKSLCGGRHEWRSDEVVSLASLGGGGGRLMTLIVSFELSDNQPR